MRNKIKIAFHIATLLFMCSLQLKKGNLNSTSHSSKAMTFTRSPTSRHLPLRNHLLTVYTAAISLRAEWQCWTVVRSVSSAPRQWRTAPSTASCCLKREQTASLRAPQKETDHAVSPLMSLPAFVRIFTSTTHLYSMVLRGGCPMRSVVKSSCLTGSGAGVNQKGHPDR